jgi:DNA-directed RNA polymerase beta subunit
VKKLTNDLPHLTKYIRRHLNGDGIEGWFVCKSQDILVGKLTPCEEDPSPSETFTCFIRSKVPVS